MKKLAKSILPSKIQKSIKKLVAKAFPTKANKLPVLPSDASPALRDMLSAWQIAQSADASAPGVHVAYYSVNVDGVYFPGEREWEPRWETLRNVFDLNGKRFLELGCNMGLLSCYMMKEGGAVAALGVDHDAEVLKAAHLVNKAYNTDVEFVQANFDTTPDWESKLLAFKPDVLSVLNVLNWVTDKERLLRFMSKFDNLIFEGHDSFEVESKRFKDIGFTDIRHVAVTERKRDVIVCRK